MKALKTLCCLLISILSINIIFGQSPLGNGSDGPLNVLNGNTYINDSARAQIVGTNLLGSNILNVKEAQYFHSGDEVLIMTMQDADTNFVSNQTGNYEINKVSSVSPTQLTLYNSLSNNFSDAGGMKHQVVKIPNYTTVTIAGTLTCSNWDGKSGGVLIFKANGVVTVTATGVIHVNGKGYRGGTLNGNNSGGGQGGESYVGLGGLGGDYNVNNAKSGAAGGGAAYANNWGRDGYAGGGGGGTTYRVGLGSKFRGGSGGGGGAHAGSGGGAGYGTPGFGGDNYNKNGKGEDGGINQSGNGGLEYTGGGGGGGGSFGYADLSRMYMGTGGGCAGKYSTYVGAIGGNGGGLMIISAKSIFNDGNIQSNGNNGGYRDYAGGGGGAGSGGTIYLQANEVNNTNLIGLAGGIGGAGWYNGSLGGNGGKGRIRIDYHVFTNTGTIDPVSYDDVFKNISTVTLTNTPNEVGPYVIEAYIFDTEGDPISAANLFYRVNGGGFSQIAMTTSDGELYTANIPGGRSLNDVIDYYITATDGIDSYKDPLNAPSEFFTFNITGNPPGSLAITDNLNQTATLDWIPPATTTNFLDYSVYRSTISGFVPNVGNRIAQNVTNPFFTDGGLQDVHTYYYKVAARYNISATDVLKYTSEINLMVNDSSLTTVAGYAFLEGETNFANIKIKFTPTSPAGELDSTYTNALGFYEIVIKPGLYDITYEKATFQTYPIRLNFSIINDLPLENATLLYLGTPVSGNVSGVWNGTYSVSNDIIVPNGDTLIIMPGSQIRVVGNYNIYVYGYLEAIGAPGDSITFTSFPANQNYGKGQWQGIDFYDASNDNSMISYAIIQYAVDGVWWSNAKAGLENARVHSCSDYGLEILEDVSDIVLRNVEVYNCTNHGIYALRADPVLYNVNSHNNSSYGAYFNNYSNASIVKCKFNNNASYGIRIISYSNISIDSSEFNNNSSWGIRTDYSESSIKNSDISHNIGYGICYNQDNNNWISPYLYNCMIEDNSSVGVYFRRYIQDQSRMHGCTVRNNGGAGVQLWYYARAQVYDNIIYGNNEGIHIGGADWSYPDVHHNIVAYNVGDGIWKDNRGAPTINYNTIYGNGGDGIEINNDFESEAINDNIIVNNGGWGVRANATIEQFQYNDVYSNTAGELSNLGYFPTDTWTFLSTNANGAPADNYLNISSEPNLELSNSKDFRLKASSVCLDGGDNTIFDPDGTPTDLGAVYRDFGNPQNLYLISYGNQAVSFKWDKVTLDSIQSYKVYIKLSAAPTYSFYQSIADSVITITGLTNNELYDFVVTGVYPNYESIYSPKVSERPGVPHVAFDPLAMNVNIVSDTLQQTLKITNVGSRNLSVNLAYGVENGYAHFDGSGDYIYTQDLSNYENMTSFTLECWVRRQNNGHMEIMGKNYRSYSLYIDGNNRFGVYKGYDGVNDLYQNWTTPYVVPVNEWHHLAVTWKENIIKFYADGKIVYEITNAMNRPIPNETYNFEIGRRAGESQYLNGDITEVRIWNRVKTQAEIQQQMNTSLSGNENGLVGYWPLHKNYNDYSSFGINGTNVGQTYFNSAQMGGAYPEVPVLFDKFSLQLAPGAQDSILFKFPNTGQIGTFVYTTPIFTNINDSAIIDYELSLTYGNEVPSTPVYFTPVPSTGKPYQVVITNAKIDGIDIQVGDELGIFDDTLCVGAGIFDGSFNLVITAWQDTGIVLNGFIPGNAMSFIVYDNSADLEATVEQLTYSIGDGNFSYGAFSSLSLTSTIYKDQIIPILENQFNLISFNRLPKDASSIVVFSDIESLKIAYNDDGSAYIPDYSINSIGDIDFRDAFYVYGTVKDTFHYKGSSINPMNWDVNIKSGKWNYISFLGENPVSIITAFADSIKDSIDVVQTSGGLMYVPSLAVNTIGNMQPGVGYQVVLSSQSDVSFNYQITNGFAKSGTVFTPVLVPEMYSPVTTGLPYNIVIENPTINDVSLSYGDEIAAFDKGVCVGACVFIGDIRTVLTTWESDETYGLPGFKANNPIEIKVYSKANDQEYVSVIEPMNSNINNLIYRGENYSYVSLKVSADISAPLFVNVESTNMVFETYPNPFSEFLTFKYNLSESTNVKLRITNVVGQVVDVVVDEFQKAGTHEIIWDGSGQTGKLLDASIYNYSFESNSIKKSGVIIKIK